VFVLFSVNLTLIRNGDFNQSTSFLKNTLAGKSGIEFRISCTVDKIFFTVGKFFQKTLFTIHIHVTGTAGTNASAIMMDTDLIFKCDFKNTLIGFAMIDLNRGQSFFFEVKSDTVHERVYLRFVGLQIYREKEVCKKKERVITPLFIVLFYPA